MEPKLKVAYRDYDIEIYDELYDIILPGGIVTGTREVLFINGERMPPLAISALGVSLLEDAKSLIDSWL